jgi:hypothetical protein
MAETYGLGICFHENRDALERLENCLGTALVAGPGLLRPARRQIIFIHQDSFSWSIRSKSSGRGIGSNALTFAPPVLPFGTHILENSAAATIRFS